MTGRLNIRGRRFALAVAMAFLGAVLAAPSPVSAQMVPDGKWWKRPRIASYIELSAEQEKQLDTMFNHTRPKLIDLKAEVEKSEFEFQTAMEEGSNADRKVIAARIEAREEARGKLQKELVLLVLDMKQVLRREQWDKLTRMQQELRERRREIREDERGSGLRPQAPGVDRRQPAPAPGDARRPGTAAAPPAAAPTQGRSPGR